MKKRRDAFIAFLRVVLGCVFVFASIDKVADPPAFAASIVNYKLVSGQLALAVATVLPWVELLAGFGLICGVFVRGSGMLTMIMLITFTALVSSAMIRGLDISCGCFTQDPAATKIGWQKLGENTLLVFINFLILRLPDNRFVIKYRL